MGEYKIDMEQVCEITKRWARHATVLFPRWELAELHNEAFLVAMHLLKSGRYKQSKGALSTFIAREAQAESPMQFLEPKPTTTNVNQDWLNARLTGMGSLELRSRGMNYQEQRRQAKILYDEQQSKRQTRGT